MEKRGDIVDNSDFLTGIWILRYFSSHNEAGIVTTQMPGNKMAGEKPPTTSTNKAQHLITA